MTPEKRKELYEAQVKILNELEAELDEGHDVIESAASLCDQIGDLETEEEEGEEDGDDYETHMHKECRQDKFV